MKKVLAVVLTLGILGSGGYGVYHHFFVNSDKTEERVSSDSEDAVYVDSVSTITGYGSGNGLIERYAGEVEPQATLEVKLEGDRKVAECYVKEGDTVKEGQRLFSYDTSEDENKLAQAEIEIERAQGEIEVSEKSIAQNEKDKKNAGADEQLTYTTYILQEQNSIKQKEYEIKTKEIEIAQLKENISQSVVTAEMGGIIQKISDSSSSDYYSYYSGGETQAYITILAEGDFRIKGTINEQNLNQGLIYEGMPMLVHSRVDDTLTWTGVITEINTENKEEENENNNYYYYSESSGSSNYAFYVELDSSEGLILGQHVYMEENVGQDEEKDGLWLEEYYLIQDGEHTFVWAASKKNLIEKREVTLGEYDEDQMKYEITEGLDAEDYIAYPSEGITEGTPVVYNEFGSVYYGDDDLGDYEDYGDDDLGGYEDYGDDDLGDYEDYGDDDLGDYEDYGDDDLGDYEDYSDDDLGDYEDDASDDEGDLEEYSEDAKEDQDDFGDEEDYYDIDKEEGTASVSEAAF